MKGQSAMESLMLVGISIVFIMPMVLVFFTTTNLRTQTLVQVQAEALAQVISDSSGEVWYMGNGSRKIVLVNYPERVLNISLSGDKINLNTPAGRAELKDAGREVAIRLDHGIYGQEDVVIQGPAPMRNGFNPAKPRQRIDYPRGYDNRVRGGLTMIVFENQGDYVNVTRYAQ